MIANVFPHGHDMHGADAEFPVTALPREIPIPWVQRLEPDRRRGLDLFDNLRRGVVLGLREQDVDVVAHGIDFDERRIVVLEDAGNVGVKLAALLIAQERTTAFGAEHEVNDKVGQGLGHNG